MLYLTHIALFLYFVTGVSAFSTGFHTASLNKIRQDGRCSSALSMGYVPDGLTPEQWQAIKQKEQAQRDDLGKVGPSGFKSRSMQAWQEAGGVHNFAVDLKKVQSGEIPPEKVPYMQRPGGSWDNSDLLEKGIEAEKVEWTDSDKKYAAGGYKKEQSVSIFSGESAPWTREMMEKNSSDKPY